MARKLSEKAATSDLGRCKRTMYEERDLQDVRPELEYIPIRHDPSRRVYVSGVPSKAEKAAEIVAVIINIGSSLILCGSCVAMVYLVAQMV